MSSKKASLIEARFDCEDGEVHVWRVSLDNLKYCSLICLRQLLSKVEVDRMMRLRIHRDRKYYLATRGILRTVLGQYLKLPPTHIRFQTGPNGKPFVRSRINACNHQFSVSKSQGLALIAVTSGPKIGVDVERVRPEFFSMQIAECFFSAQEVKKLLRLPSHERIEAFFNCWTRKEAFLKARGDGLSLPLHQFDVSLAPGELAALISTRWNPEEIHHWHLQSLNPGLGFSGALAVEGQLSGIKLRRWVENEPSTFHGANESPGVSFNYVDGWD